jgi:hypothetical protein
MLIASFSVPSSARSRHVPRLTTRVFRPPTKPLVSWLIIGLVALLCVPVVRGGRTLGATLPFWLIVAPLIDLAWVDRRRIARWTMELVGKSARRATARNRRRQRPPRSAACSAARS